MDVLKKSLFILMFLGLSSCLLPSEKGKVSLNLSSKDQEARDRSKKGQVSVASVSLVNDEIVITGTDLDGVTKVKVTQSGSDSLLSIVSKSATKLILSSSFKVALALNTLMTLTLEDAYGAAVIEVTFNLPDSSVSTAKIGDDQVTTAKIADGAITSVKLSSMGALTGQLLRWNGSSWVAADLDALTYAGTWDASIGGNPNPSAVGGEYYIVSNDGVSDPGDGNSRSWSQGDWIVYNDVTASWDQISNSSDVTSFNGRTGGIVPTTGDYTWAQIDKSTSSIGDISDVDLTTIAPSAGKILKYDGSQWVVGDDLSGGGAGSVSSTEIADGSIVDADVSGSAAISWSKIDKTGATNSDVGLGNVDNIQQMPLSYLDQTVALGTDTNKVPSQNAVKTYVDNATSGMGTVTSITGGAALSDGPYTTTGTIDVQVDNSTIEVVTDALQLKDGGITNAKINASAAIAWSKIDKTGASKTDVGLGNVDNIQQMPLSYLDQTATLGTDANKVPSQNAVKTYVDNQVGGVNQSQWITNASDIYYNSGNVGIGLSVPKTSLEIKTPGTGSAAGKSQIRLVSPSGNIGTTSNEIVGGIDFSSDDLDVDTNVASIRALTEGSHFNATDLPTGLAFYTMNTGAMNEKMRIDKDGNVGIGTTSPNEKFVVENGSILMKNNAATNDQLYLYYISASNYASISTASSGGLEFNTGTSSPSTKMYISPNSGNVGIGTTTPSTKLEVAGTITATGFNGPLTSTNTSVGAGSASDPSYTFTSDSDTGFYSGTADTIEVSVGGTNIFDMSSTSIASASNGGGILRTVSSSVTTPTFSFSGDEDTGWFSPSENTLAASTGGSERVRIMNSGRIGIGSTNPASMLDVNGSISQRPQAIGSSVNYLRTNAANVQSLIDLNPGLLVYSNSNHYGMDLGYSGSRFRTRIFTPPTADISFSKATVNPTKQSDFTDLMVINGSSGNVGIGTTTPSTKLEVNGTITASGLNGPLTSTTASVGAGSAANPSYTFTSDTDTGFYSGTADTIEVSVGGTNIFDMNTTSIASTASGGGVLRTVASTSTNPTFSFNGDENTGWFSPAADNLAASTNGLERIRIDNNGNVGIGTSSPTEKLYIVGGGVVINDNNDIGAPVNVGNTPEASRKLSLQASTISGNSLDFGLDSSFSWIQSRNIGDYSISSDISLNPNGGNVGIGTANPRSMLQIGSSLNAFTAGNDNLHLGRNIYFDGVNYKRTIADNDVSMIYMDNVGDIKFYTNSDINNTIDSTVSLQTNLTIKKSGNIGIGNPAPQSRLSVGGDLGGGYALTAESLGQYGAIIQTDQPVATNSAALWIRTTPDSGATTNTLLRVQNDGNVGIGTNNPQDKLEVSGAVTINQYQRLGFYRFNSSSSVGTRWLHLKTNQTMNSVMQTVEFKGYDYGASKTIDAQISYYPYSSSGTITNINSIGSHSLSAYKSADGYAVVAINANDYYLGFVLNQYGPGPQGLFPLTITSTMWSATSTGAF